MEELFINFIGNYAFPIVMCVYLAYMNEKQDIRHREEINELSNVISNNTSAIDKILEHIRKG